ncbi:MAG: PilZ domain-containing protein [Desulfobacterales bacterium]|nr:PilZ domain-containing protein [Desulfobacterales bacterium]
MNTYKDRLYERYPLDSSIIFLNYQSNKVYDASMFNFSQGGMYFETKSKIIAGTKLFIKQKNYFEEVFPPSECQAEVRWCKEITNPKLCEYGIGVKYSVRNCDLCGDQVIYQGVYPANNFIHLCSQCISDRTELLFSLSDRKLREKLGFYLNIGTEFGWLFIKGIVRVSLRSFLK